MKGSVEKVYLLSDAARKPLPVKASGDTIIVQLASVSPGEYATVLRLKMK